MPVGLVIGILSGLAVFILIIVVGSGLFTLMIEEQIRYLRLIVLNTPLSAVAGLPSAPWPVTWYRSRAAGENRDSAGCVHIRHAGRIRYGKTGRWMNMSGEAFFSLATPGFVGHAKIAWAPGIWLEAFHYYIRHEAGMKLHLFSVLPLCTARTGEIEDSSLFRYLAGTPLFPLIFKASHFISWEPVHESMVKAIIRDEDRSVEAFVRFDDAGWIKSIEACQTTHPKTGRRIPGLFSSSFSGYTDVGGYQIPMKTASELLLPGGDYLQAEYTLTGIEFDIPKRIQPGGC
ncbi:DUF6544 family protein [Methanoregula sp.]|jgi:hypothetical protein|uniref:DUF6544 family protein n=1 Tax=Methanoregula sp. TaxID=2052170 RepID=UPI003562A203